MRQLSIICALLFLSLGERQAFAIESLSSLSLPAGGGKIVEACFSPDGKVLAVVKRPDSTGSGKNLVLQVFDVLEGPKEKIETSLGIGLEGKPLLKYSYDGRYLLLAEKATDKVSVIDANTLQMIASFAVYSKNRPGAELTTQRSFSGIVSISAASQSDRFALLTHDESRGNEVFVGTFPSGRALKSWTLGRGRFSTQLGEVSISIGSDGKNVAVSLLPEGNSMPAGFNNLQLYDSSTGVNLSSIRTSDFIGQIALLPQGEILATRIDTPGFFARKTCIEKWSTKSKTLIGQYCDAGGNVTAAVSATPAGGTVVGFVSRVRKSIEGQVYSAVGRVDVWDGEAGTLLATSDRFPHFVSSIQINADGEWIFCDQTLLRIHARATH